MLKTYLLTALLLANTATIFAQPFITTWKTDNTGTSSNTEITIPTYGTGYNYNVYWEEVNNANNNGVHSNVKGSKIINFGTSGTYRVEISGDFPRIYFNNLGDKDKLLTVDQWGGNAWSNMSRAFYGCSNLTIPAPDTPNLRRVESMSIMFYEATSLTVDRIHLWDVSSVKDMYVMFYGATSFNQDLGGWNVSKVYEMRNMLKNSGLSNVNYNNTLIGWSEQEVQTGITLGAAGLTYSCDAAEARALLTETKSWTIVGDRGCSFITTWKIDNTGTSSATEITIPTDGTGYKYTVYWEDVNNPNKNGLSFNVTGSKTIDFLTAGTYRVEISGDFPRIFFNNVGDKDKLLSVDQWGGIEWSSMKQSFYGCSNLTIPAPDAPDLSSVTDMTTMFYEATSLTVDSIHLWDVSSVTHMYSTFYEATSFNQDLSSWDISSIIRMDNMLKNSGLSTDNYDKLLIGWSTQGVKTGLTLGAAGLSYSCDAAEARALLTETKSWTIVGDRGCSFITTWKTDNTSTSSDTEITIPTTGGGYKYTVYWEDVNNPSKNGLSFNVTGSKTIDFDTAGTYRVEISGDFPWFYFNNGGDKDKLLSVDQWGGIEWNRMSQSFSGCSNLTIPARDAPDLSRVKDMTEMFTNATSLTVDSIHLWNVSSVTHMYSTFLGATSFNQDLSSWDVSSVINMYSMFRDATSFNQDLSSWNVSNVSHMGSVFSGATSFNQDLSDWDVSSVTTMLSMFSGATSFDQNLGDWDVSTVGISGMGNMLDSTALSVDNYDSLLIGWSTQGVKTGTTLGAAGLRYSCDAAEARALLTETKSWTIVGDQIYCPFITTWNTGNSTEITIPTFDGEVYSYDVYWEEVGNSDNNSNSPDSATATRSVDLTGLTENRTINFGASGTYRVEISGDFPRIYFNNVGDKDKLLTVDQWGGIAWSNMEHAFFGCSNLTIPSLDAPDLSNVMSMRRMFEGDTSLTVGSIHLWKVGNVENMSNMFSEAKDFNQDIGGWNVGHVTNMYAMFYGATKFNQDLSGWDISDVTDMGHMFRDATDFDQDLSVWNVSGVEIMYSMFYNATSFDQDLSGWNVSLIKDMEYMFRSAISFDQDLSNWNVSGVTNMTGMLDFSGLSIENYDGLLIGWSEQEVQTEVTLGAAGLRYSCAANVLAARALLMETKDWTITGDRGCSFITTWNTGNSTEITIPTFDGEVYDYNMYWEEVGNSGNNSNSPDNATATRPIDLIGLTKSRTINFGTSGTYRVEISGEFPRIYFNYGGDKDKLLTVDQWGDIAWSSMERSFSGCSNLTAPAPDAPDLSHVTDMSSMFAGATSFNQDLSGWNVGLVTDMDSMFAGAIVFDQNLDNWNVSLVTNMSSMFADATSFNQSLSGWDVGLVTDMDSMFAGAIVFDQNLDNWNVSLVRNMSSMFADATSFNQSLSGWDVGLVTDMDSMFAGAIVFDQNLDNWNVSLVRDMSSMFSGATSFNQSLSGWDVGLVTDMDSMFAGAIVFDQNLDNWNVSLVRDMSSMFSDATSFNQSLSDWNVNRVTNMSYMFSNATSFNQSLSDWNVSLVRDMSSMFSGATSFNQSLSGWDVGLVTGMDSMFAGAIVFDQNLDNWNVSGVTDMDNMLDNTALSIAHYDSLLIGWSEQEVQTEVRLGAAGLTYSCDAVAARALLTETKDWTITGDQVYCPFITTWNTGNSTEITIPTFDGEVYSYNVYWEEVGNSDNNSNSPDSATATRSVDLTGLTENKTIDFGTSGTYRVEISGTFPHIYFNNVGDKDKLLRVENWGTIAWSSMEGAFQGCNNLTIPASDVPDLSNVRSMSRMFADATSFNQALSSWNVSRVTDMGNMLDNTALSELNYENTILSWEQQPVQENVELGVEGLTYCTIGETPRQSLIDDKNWNIIGDTECLILPITLLSIEAKVIDGLVHIIWETASEIDNEYFTLERSKVGNSFEELSTIEGGGNSNQRRGYSFIDEQPYSGTSYYKLKQTDFSGATAVVGLLLVKTSDSEEELQLTVYPNPFSDTGISIVLLGANEKETVTISIVDVLGRVQYTSRKQVDDQGELNLTLSDLGQWNTGLYIIQVFTEKGTIKTSTIKQK